MNTEGFQILSALKPYLDSVETTQYTRRALRQEDGNLLRRCASKLSSSSSFNRFVSCSILLNFAVMIIETDQSAQEDRQHDVIVFCHGFGWASLILFVFELSVRLIARGRSFWADPWDLLDFMVIFIDVACSLIGIIAGNIFPISVLRTVRLVKLAKVSKMTRVFPELRLLLAALVGSFSAIFWGTILLLIVSLLWAMVAVTVIHPLAADLEYMDCERCPRAYSSVMNAALTFWQTTIAGDSWGKYAIPILENYPATIMFFLPLYLSIGMAVLHLILGVVVDVAMESKEALLNDDRKERALNELGRKTQLLELCADMDIDQCGMISRSDLRDAFMRPGIFRDCVLSLGISDEDFDVVWAVINADNKGAVSYKEFVNNISSLKHSDAQFMLTYIKYYITMMQDHIKSILRKAEIVLEKEELLAQVVDQEDAHLHLIECKQDEILQCESQILEEVAVSTGKQEEGHGLWRSNEQKVDQQNSCKQSQAAGVQRTCPVLYTGHSGMRNLATSLGEQSPSMDGEVDVLFARIRDVMAIFHTDMKLMMGNMQSALKAQTMHALSMEQAKEATEEQEVDVVDVTSSKEAGDKPLPSISL